MSEMRLVLTAGLGQVLPSIDVSYCVTSMPMKLPGIITEHVFKDAFSERMPKVFKEQGFASSRYDSQQFSIDLGAQDGGVALH